MIPVACSVKPMLLKIIPEEGNQATGCEVPTLRAQTFCAAACMLHLHLIVSDIQKLPEL